MFVRYWGNSGQRSILAGDGLSANDPKRKWSVHRSSRDEVNMCGDPLLSSTLFQRVSANEGAIGDLI